MTAALLPNLLQKLFNSMRKIDVGKGVLYPFLVAMMKEMSFYTGWKLYRVDRCVYVCVGVVDWVFDVTQATQTRKGCRNANIH